MVLRITVPPGVRGGQTINVGANGRSVLVRLPDAAQPGQECEFRLPAASVGAPGGGSTAPSGARAGGVAGAAGGAAAGAGGVAAGAASGAPGGRPSLLRRVGSNVAAKVDALRTQRGRATVPAIAGRERYGQINDSEALDAGEMYV